MEHNDWGIYFKELPIPAHLTERVLCAVHVRQKHLLIYRYIFLGILSAGSFVGSVFAYISLAHSFAQSGFLQYISLMFSDGGTLMSAWKDFLLVLAESLPLFETAVFLAALTVCVLALYKVTKVRRYKSLAYLPTHA
jgi:hypothetical protein